MTSRGIDRRTAELSLAYLLVGFTAFLLAAVAGLLQGLVRGGVITLPKWLDYYAVLTAHGVLMGLIFTTFVIIGFFFSGVAKSTGGQLTRKALNTGWIAWAMMIFGTAMGVATIVTNNATVLYTFYAPLKASPWFYIGTTLLIVGSWVAGLAMFLQYREWRRLNGTMISPLFTFMALTTMLMWFLASLGVAAAVLFQFIPWSFGWVDKINVLLTRTLFWFFGHPLVYFWLMPAYTAWYVVMPKIIGQKVFSDSLARMAFVLFLILSIPIGLHHQLTEPGVEQQWKFLHVALTLSVAFPSMLTAFAMFATFERYGRSKGARGLFGWFTKLPWSDARFFTFFVAMAWFIPAGIGGIINASNQLNVVVHNTIWVTGHFHLTVGTTVALTFFGFTYWLIPTLTGRQFTRVMNRLGILQTVTWSLGMMIMSGAMHFMGLQGVPRRTSYTTYGDFPLAVEWMTYERLMAIGGSLLFVGGVMMFCLVIYMTFFAPKSVKRVEYPIAESAEPLHDTPKVFDKWPLWIAMTVVMIILAYGYPVYDLIQNPPPGSPPIRSW
jgi:cytochrome c oxidase subunit 1